MKIYREIEPNKPKKELPNLRETRQEELKKRRMKYIWDVLSSENERQYDFKIEKNGKYPTVSLSWKCRVEAVTHWMKMHLEAYPETWKGFRVDFIDGEENSWYKVDLCKHGQNWDIEINWVKYRIKPLGYADNMEIKSRDSKNYHYNEKNKINFEKYKGGNKPN